MINFIEKFSENNNLVYGITDSSYICIKNSGITVPFVNCSYEERINPLLQMDNCKSIIVFLMNYKINTFDNKNKPRIASPNERYDYHSVMSNKLLDLAKLLEARYNIEYKVFVDTGNLIERELAKKAGLGYFSKNTNLINEQFGSCFNIGYIMIDKELPYNNNIINKNCGDCQICQNSCPTKAINGDYTINHYKCMSYINQKKDDLTEEEKKLLGNKIYGCSVCAEVCPHNKKNLYNEETSYNYSDFLNNTKKQFKEKFGNKGFCWRGNTVLKRNSIIAYNNSLERK